MLNRLGIQSRLVRTDNRNEPRIEDLVTYERKAKIIAQASRRVIMTIAIAVCAYVALDTSRQVLVTHAEKQ